MILDLSRYSRMFVRNYYEKQTSFVRQHKENE